MNLLDWFFGEGEYTVTYYSFGYMGNKYPTGAFTFKAPKRKMKNKEIISDKGFALNFNKLKRHYKIQNDGFYHYEYYVHENEHTMYLLSE